MCRKLRNCHWIWSFADPKPSTEPVNSQGITLELSPFFHARKNLKQFLHQVIFPCFSVFSSLLNQNPEFFQDGKDTWTGMGSVLSEIFSHLSDPVIPGMQNPPFPLPASVWVAQLSSQVFIRSEIHGSAFPSLKTCWKNPNTIECHELIP